VLTIYPVAEDDKCGHCNYRVDTVFLLANSEEEAAKYYKVHDRGLCADCMVRMLMEDNSEIKYNGPLV
jgi:hypothetical protein